MTTSVRESYIGLLLEFLDFSVLVFIRYRIPQRRYDLPKNKNPHMFSDKITDVAVETNRILQQCPLSPGQLNHGVAASSNPPFLSSGDRMLSAAQGSSGERTAQLHSYCYIQEQPEVNKKGRHGFRFNYKTMRGICNALSCDDSAPALLIHSQADLIWDLFNHKPRVSWSLLKSN